MNTLKVGFLGAGKMAYALCSGWLSAGLIKHQNIIASAHPADKSSIDAFKSLGTEVVTTNKPVVENSQIVFISVKPNTVKTVLDEVKSISNGKLFVSIAMGIGLKEIQDSLCDDTRVIRVMPNTPAIVQAGCSCLVKGCTATNDDVDIVKKLFQKIGICEEVSEYNLDVITALAGSGPAYVFVFIEALADGAVKMGLPRDLAYRLAAQTVLGSGKLMIETNTHPGVLKDNVTSPGGSTASGLHHLEKNRFRSAVIDCVEAATLRCREISGRSD